MKKILMAAVAITAISATPAMAAPGDSSSTYTVSGTVSGQCGGLSAVGGTIDFGTITPNANGTVSVLSPTTSPFVSTVYCNSTTAKITIAGNSIVSGSNTLSYTPVVKLDGADLASGGSVGSGGQLSVSAANLNSGTAIAAAGVYSGTLTVTLSPQ